VRKKSWYADGLRFECTRCSRCCLDHKDPAFVYLTRAEVKALARHLRMSLKAFKKDYTTTDDGDLVLKNDGPRCILLGEDGLCAAYACRPRQCRTWPFWHENLIRHAWNGPVKALCPGIDQGRLHTREEIKEAADWTDAEEA